MTRNPLLHDAHLPTSRRAAGALPVVSLLLLCGVAAAETRAPKDDRHTIARLYSPPACRTEDLREGAEQALLACWAPVFEVEGGDRSFNRIG